MQLATVVLTYNEQGNLPACIASLAGLRCQLVVVDSGSTDRTLAIAGEGGALVLEHPFEHYAAQRNWALLHLPQGVEWVLNLDADERLTPDLVHEINDLLADPPADIDGFLLCKRTVFLGRWMKHGGHYPSYHLRLFRNHRGRCEERLYDQHFVVHGQIRRLRHDYIDVVASNLTTWTVRHALWAELEAIEMRTPRGLADQVHPALFGNPIERKRWLRQIPYARAPLFWRAFLYWLYRYVVRRGFLDVTQGLIFHFLQGFWFRFLVDAKMVELRQSQPHGGVRPDIT